MTLAMHTLKLRVGRIGPITCSAGSLSAEDERSLRALATLLVNAGSPDAAAGATLPSGHTVMLRRMRSTSEVRGLLDPVAADEEALRAWIGDHPFWAASGFRDARPVDRRTNGGTHPLPWCDGLESPPAGCVRLGAAPRPQAAVTAVGHADARARVDTEASHGGRRIGDRPLRACAAVTAAAATFFTICAIVAAARTGSP